MGLDGLAQAVESEDLGPPRTRPCQPQKQADGRRLAGPVRPEVADNLTLRHLELKVDQRTDSAVVLPKTLGAYRWRVAHMLIPSSISIEQRGTRPESPR